ncbi:hypothetical protein TSA66_02645 [Noviherbaspirillum autotrophicum]|uniref:Cytochrome c domain-containing protein n=1 Tax=Noviherbaspirillum autotrophicum TaxID=709839 RepID=A0A0C2BQA7_9BURK|nr:hypothetical protein TSA66_02645 [Noviherbaspirillum autotrophicum]
MFSTGASCLIAISSAVEAATESQLARGELLYSTHCLACHTEQMHWRDRGLVTDMDSLLAQVRRWQNVSRARWSEADIEAVTQYLNSLYYKFPSARQDH